MKCLNAAVFVGALTLLLSASLCASTETIQIEVMGFGQDREEATFDALTEAIRQVHGVDLASTQVLNRSTQEMVLTETDGSSTSLKFSLDARGEISADSAGYISGYRVLSVADRDPGLSIRLLVDLPVYVGPGKRTYETRRRMAVYPFAAERGLTLLGQPVDSISAASGLTQAVINSMTQTRRFAMLERENSLAIQQERQLLSSPDIPVEEKAKLGRTLGADYVLIGTLVAMDVDIVDQTSSLTGEQQARPVGSIVVNMRVLSPATRQVHWSDTVSLELQHILADGGIFTSPAGFEQLLWQKIADELTGRAVGSIYPLRPIEMAADGTLVLNQGGSQVRAGQTLQIFELGGELFDPYSGESLGRHEREAAVVKVLRVTDRLSFAEIIEGHLEEVTPARYLAREMEHSTGSAPVGASRGTRRSVRLPQDG